MNNRCESSVSDLAGGECLELFETMLYAGYKFSHPLTGGESHKEQDNGKRGELTWFIIVHRLNGPLVEEKKS